MKAGLSTSKKVIFVCSNESPSKMMKSAFYFMLKALFVLKHLSFCPDIFDHVEKRLLKEAKFNFKMYDATGWTTNNCNTYIAQYLKK